MSWPDAVVLPAVAWRGTYSLYHYLAAEGPTWVTSAAAWAPTVGATANCAAGTDTADGDLTMRPATSAYFAAKPCDQVCIGSIWGSEGARIARQLHCRSLWLKAFGDNAYEFKRSGSPYFIAVRLKSPIEMAGLVPTWRSNVIP